MLPSFLLPNTLAHRNGQGDSVRFDSPPGRPLNVTLEITRILERHSLTVFVMGSPDGHTWERLAAFPPKSYCGTYSLLLDLEGKAHVRMLRVDWSMSPWTAAGRTPVFGFHVVADQAHARATAGAA